MWERKHRKKKKKKRGNFLEQSTPSQTALASSQRMHWISIWTTKRSGAWDFFLNLVPSVYLLPKISFAWSSCLSVKVYLCCFWACLLRLTWHLASYAWKSHTEFCVTLFEKQRRRESLLPLPSEQSSCQPLDCAQIFADDPTAALKHKHLRHTVKLDRNSPYTFRNISSTKLTYTNKTSKCCMELMLLSTPECCPQWKASV